MKFQTIKTQITKMGMTAAVAATCGILGGLGGWVAMSVASELRAENDAYYIPYQGQLDLGGQPVDGPTNFVFSLYEAPDAEAPIWVSNDRVIQVSSGYFAVVLGDDGDAARIDTSIMGKDALYVGMTVDGVALEGRQRLLGVPFAQHAAAGKVFVVDNQIYGRSGAKIDGHTEVDTLSADSAVIAGELAVTGAITGDEGATIDGTSALSSVTVNDSLTVDGSKLMSNLVRFEKFRLDELTTLNTTIPTADWTCAVGSIDYGYGDIDEDNHGRLPHAYTYKNGSTWHVRVDFRTHNAAQTWRHVGIICFRNNIVEIVENDADDRGGWF